MKLTVEVIQEALKGNDFWLLPESQNAKVINEAEIQGYIRRTSHTQAEWISQEQIDKLDSEIKKTEIDEVTKIYEVDEVYETLEEMLTSKIAVEKFKMYEHVIAQKRRLLSGLFQKAYRIGTKIFYELKLDEGFNVLHELELGSCLSNASFCTYLVFGNKVMIIRSRYENSKANRIQFQKQNINVTTIFNIC